MAKSDTTKAYKALKIIVLIAHILLCIVPVVISLIIGKEQLQGTSLYLVIASLIVAGIIEVIGLVFKQRWYAPLFLILTSLCLTLNAYKGIITMFAICLAVDELVVYPFFKKFRAKAIINKEIDERIARQEAGE